MSAKRKRRNRTEVTMEQAKAAWDMVPQPTDAKVADFLTDNGKPICKTTIYHWRMANWSRPSSQVWRTEKPDPEKDAKAAEKIEAQTTTANLQALQKLLPTFAVEDLEKLSDSDLLRRANRHGTIVTIALLDELRKHGSELILLMPKALSDLIKAVSDMLLTVNEGFEKFSMVRERLLKEVSGIIDAVPQIEKPSERMMAAIEQWGKPYVRQDSAG